MDKDELVDLLRRGVGAPVADAPPPEPRQPPLERAVAEWALAEGLTRGKAASPPAAPMVPLFVAWAAERGWEYAPTGVWLARALTATGLETRHRGNRRGFSVPERTAERLWAAVGLAHKPRKHPPPPPKRLPPLGLVLASSLGELRHALVDSLGCVWKDAVQAAGHVRCTPRSVVVAATPRASGNYVAGRRHWRRLGKPSEWLEKLPEGARFGVPGTMCWCRGTACMVPYVP